MLTALGKWHINSKANMVLLTMTAAMVACLEHYGRLEGDLDMGEHDDLPSLKAPAIGKPISHTQILAVSKHLKTAESAKKCKEKDVIDTSIEYHLDQLLRGSKVYIEPSILKAEPVSGCIFYIDTYLINVYLSRPNI